MELGGGRHLGYCTNVHPYATLEGLVEALEQGAGPLRERLAAGGHIAGDQSLGVGLWLPREVAFTVASDPAPLRDVLAEHGLYCFTVNAFPAGDFHGAVVKDAVFRPSWAERARLDFTLSAATALAALLPDGLDGSISTHTGAYKPWGAGENDHAALAAGFVAAADGLAALEDATGKRIVLALEPEPLSTLETTAEVVSFFTRHLQASAASRRHLGLCYDACHQAVEFEDAATSLDALVAADIALAKVQLSSAIRLPHPAADAALLTPFAEDRWFHQVVGRRADGSLERHPDLPAALADPRAAQAVEWRVHFHVPLFAPDLDGEGRLATTRPDLGRVLAWLSENGGTDHLEIETYSFGMIPRERRADLGATDLLDCLVLEFEWVLEQWEHGRTG